MSISLHEHLRKNIKKMISGMDKNSKGNIYPLVMEEVERCIIELVLEETNFNYLLSSKMLGVGRSTLYRKIESLGIKLQKQKIKSDV